MSEDILEKTVLKGGYCIGCGVCAAVQNSPMKIELNNDLKFEAKKVNVGSTNLSQEIAEVCPFSNESINEDEIGKEVFNSSGNYNNKLGFFIDTFAGHVSQGSIRENGSSGGMGTWILSELLRLNFIDKVIHVKPSSEKSNDNKLFKYAVSRTAEEIQEGAKSRYYPIELSEVLKTVRNEEGRYAIVGLPCFIKSVRLLARKDAEINKKILFYVGLVCGHLKSGNFADMFSLQLGVHPNNLTGINFREKLNDYGANHYGVSIDYIKDGKKLTKVSQPINKLYGANWGWGLFKYKACDYCDDVVGETADITIGDAWLPKYVNDSQGTNIVIIRNKRIKTIIDNAIIEKRLKFDKISPEEVIQSQESGFRHRRDSLAYRLHLTDKKKLWRPEKRILASDTTITDRMKDIQNLRMEMAERSHLAFKKAKKENDFSVFKKEMKQVVEKYNSYYKVSLIKKLMYHLKKVLK